VLPGLSHGGLTALVVAAEPITATTGCHPSVAHLLGFCSMLGHERTFACLSKQVDSCGCRLPLAMPIVAQPMTSDQFESPSERHRAEADSNRHEPLGPLLSVAHLSAAVLLAAYTLVLLWIEGPNHRGTTGEIGDHKSAIWTVGLWVLITDCAIGCIAQAVLAFHYGPRTRFVGKWTVVVAVAIALVPFVAGALGN
jgi:hypothetical protein